MAADWRDWSNGGGSCNYGEANLVAAAPGWGLLAGFPFTTGSVGDVGDVRNRIIVVTVGGVTRCYAGSERGRFYAVDMAGAEVWGLNLHGGAIIRTTAVSDGTNVGWGDDAGNFDVRDAVTGAAVWTENVGAAIRGSPVLIGANVAWAANNGVVYCRNFTTGAVVWTVNLALVTTPNQPLLAIGGNVYVPLSDTAVAVVRVLTGAAGVLVHDFTTGGSNVGPIASAVDTAGLTHLVIPCDDHYTYDYQALSPFGYIWTKLGSGANDAAGPAFDVNENRLAAQEHNSSAQLWFLDTGKSRAKQDSQNTAGNTPLALQSSFCVAGTGVAGQNVSAIAMAAGDRIVRVRDMSAGPGGWSTLFKYPNNPSTHNPFLHSSPSIARGRMFIGGEDHNGSDPAGIYAFG